MVCGNVRDEIGGHIMAYEAGSDLEVIDSSRTPRAGVVHSCGVVGLWEYASMLTLSSCEN